MRITGARVKETIIPKEDIEKIELFPKVDAVHIIYNLQKEGMEAHIDMNMGLDDFDIVFGDETYLYMDEEDMAKEIPSYTLEEWETGTAFKRRTTHTD